MAEDSSHLQDARYWERFAEQQQAAAVREAEDEFAAIRMAQESLMMSKEGQYCPHGIEYTTGKLHPDHPDAERVFGYTLVSVPLWHLCPCCCKVLPSWNVGDKDGLVTTNGGYCRYCECEPGLHSQFAR